MRNRLQVETGIFIPLTYRKIKILCLKSQENSLRFRNRKVQITDQMSELSRVVGATVGSEYRFSSSGTLRTPFGRGCPGQCRVRHKLAF
jgi:hypothetical protein